MWFRGLGCSLRRAGPAVWRVLVTASCVGASGVVGLVAAGSQVGRCTSSAISFALLGFIADSEYVDNMGYSGR